MATKVVDIAGCERILALLAELPALASTSGDHHFVALQPVERRVATETRQEVPFGDVSGVVERAALAPLLDPKLCQPGLHGITERRDRFRGLDLSRWPRQRRSARLIEDVVKRCLGVLRCKGATRARPISGAPDDCSARRASSRVADVRAAQCRGPVDAVEIDPVGEVLPLPAPGLLHGQMAADSSRSRRLGHHLDT
jgi:hypothetical protein